MEVILLNTNLAVRAAVCQVALNATTKYVILTDQPNIEQFLKFLDFNNCKTYYFKSAYNFWQINDILKQKKKIKRFLSFNFSTLHFYHQAYGDLYNWIVNYCHKKGVSIEHHRVMPQMNYPWKKLELKDILLILQYRLFYNTEIRIMNEASTSSPYILPEFYKKNSVQESEIVINEEIIQKCSSLIRKKLNLSNSADIVFLSGSILSLNRIKPEIYEEFVEQLLNSLPTERIIAKCHPRFNDELCIEKKLAHIPSFIPMGFLLDGFDYFIGYTSTVLREAALEGKIAISLLDYIPSPSIEDKKYWFSYFSGINILYPKTIEELKCLVIK